MNNTLHISAALDQPELLENMVEKLAYRTYDIGYGKALVPKSLQAIETSSAEIYVSGTVEFIFKKDERIRIPFITNFLFTCTKGKNDPYKLTWSMSLS